MTFELLETIIMKNKIQKNVCLVNDSENDLCTTAGKTINTVFLAEKDYPQNKKINFVIFYNDLCIPLNSNLYNLCYIYLEQ